MTSISQTSTLSTLNSNSANDQKLGNSSNNLSGKHCFSMASLVKKCSLLMLALPFASASNVNSRVVENSRFLRSTAIR